MLQGTLVSWSAAIANLNEDTYIPLLCACGRTGQVENAFIILKVGGGSDKIYGDHIVPVVTHTPHPRHEIDLGLAATLCLIPPPPFDPFLKMMQEHGPKPTDESLIALIQSLRERGTGKFDTTLEVRVYCASELGFDKVTVL